MLDLKIINGTVVDGTGRDRFRADVGIKGGRITAVGRIRDDAESTIDAADRIVCPGFIDVHTHYDAQAFWDPTLSPSSLHGVTSVFGGFCGFSIAPLTPEAGEYLLPMLARVEGMPESTLRAGVPWDWSSFGSFLQRLEKRLALNAGFFVGHSAVRRVAMGARATGEKATATDLDAMKRLVADSLREGAMGFSTTISNTHNDADGQPVPSRWASREEHLALASVVREFEGTGLEMLPGLQFTNEIVELLADFSLAGERPVNWNLLTLHQGTPDQVARAEEQLAASDFARAKGAEVIALTLPGATTLRINLRSGFVYDSLPGAWPGLFRLPIAERISRLRDAQYRATLEADARRAMAAMAPIVNWQAHRVAEVSSAKNRDLIGMTLAQIGERLGKAPFDAMLEVAIEDELQTSFSFSTGSDDLETLRARAKLWKDDRTIIGGSDAGAHIDMIDTFAFSTTFLQMAVRETELLSLEEAVHQLTQAPASLMGLRGRGTVAQNGCADLVVFDPTTIRRGPVYTRYDMPGAKSEGRLFADPIGIEHVLVNGICVVRDRVLTEARPGTVLRSGRDTATVQIPAARRTH